MSATVRKGDTVRVPIAGGRTTAGVVVEVKGDRCTVQYLGRFGPRGAEVERVTVSTADAEEVRK